jgi:hypothetical protein
LRRYRGIDVSLYLRAFPLLARHPQIMLAPFLAGLANIVLATLMPGGTGFLAAANSGLAGLFSVLISSFGLGVAIIVADSVWRYGRAPFRDAWEQARRKGGDIIMSAFGVSFVIYMAGLVGSVVPVVGPIGLILVATYFMIYALPAASIGGVPGFASLQSSIDRARAAVLPSIIVTIAYIVVYDLGRSVFEMTVVPALIGRGPFTSELSFSVLDALVQAPFAAYVALVLAKTYDDVSYGRMR